MRTRTIRLEFVTPAFLGGADQSSEWRTPPFKALLRQWWRVWAARKFGVGHQGLREIEGVVFGHAALRHNGRPWHVRSAVRLRLRPVRHQTLTSWSPTKKVHHREVNMPADKMVGSDLYLGYGPLVHKGGTRLKAPPALAPGSSAELTLRHPERLSVDEFATVEVAEGLEAALRLIHLFGTVGSRSRNGWGSLRLSEEGRALVPFEKLIETATPYARPLERCLETEWADGIGTDGKGLLVWRTKEAYRDWKEVIHELARVKIAFRTKLEAGKGTIAERHLLAYPVTHHQVNAWGATSRLANQLRFKVHRLEDGRLVGLAVHLPAGLPGELLHRLPQDKQAWVRRQQIVVWRKVHKSLDKEMSRCRS